MKSNRGRTRGATSFCEVTLDELNRIFKPGAKIPVARRFAEMVKLNGRRIVGNTDNLIALAFAEQVAIEDVDLSNDADDNKAPLADIYNPEDAAQPPTTIEAPKHEPKPQRGEKHFKVKSNSVIDSLSFSDE